MSRSSVIMSQRLTSLSTMTNWTGLAQFLDDKCKELGLSWREASIKAGLDHAAISRFIRGTTPSPESCRKLAKFFSVDEDLVLTLAGHKGERLSEADELTTEAMVLIEEMMRDLPEDRQWKIYKMIRLEIEDYREQQPEEESDDESEQVSRKAS